MDKIILLIPQGKLVVTSVAGSYQLFKAAIEETRANAALLLAGDTDSRQYMGGLFSVHPHCHWESIDRAGLIIVPAFEDISDIFLEGNKPLIKWLAEQYRRGADIASLCTGSFMLAEAGLLDGKRCTTHWMFAPEFLRRYKKTNFRKHSIITDDNHIYTSGGASSFFNLIVYLIEIRYGKELGQLIAKVFQIDYCRNTQEQFAVFETQKRHQDEAIIKVQDYIEAHFSEKISNSHLAKIAKLSPRTMARRFKAATGNTPIEYLQRVRIEAAKDMLATTDKQIGEIQYATGYNDSKAFRDIFTRYTGLLPKQYQRNYRPI